MSETVDLVNVSDLDDEEIRKLAAALSIGQARTMATALRLIGMGEISKLIGVTYHRVKTLRRNSGKSGGIPNPDELPAEIPGDTGGPIYLEREIMTWAKQTGRVDISGSPIRLRAGGRPAKSGKTRERDEAGRFTG